MAQVQVNFISNMLLRTVTVNIIVPLDKIPLLEQEKREDKPFKTLYLLHGIYGNYTDYISGTRIQRWAEENNLVVVMPSGENQYYTDKDEGQEYYGRFIGQELVEFTRKMFPLSTKKEDTFIAGLSMGGYGALINGLKYSDTFGYIGAFSPGLVLEDIVNQTDLLKDFGWTGSFYDRALGKRETLLGSDRDYKFLIKELISKRKEIPNLYFAIGTEDFLYGSLEDYLKFLTENKVKFTYEEGPGEHDWDFWDCYLKRFLDWLPLENGEQGLNSGNVMNLK